MNIFLDSNVFHTDPFLTKGKKAILLKLSQHEDVNLFICETVYSEVERHHKTFLEKELKNVEESLSRLSPFLSKGWESFNMQTEMKSLLGDFSSHFEDLEDEGRMTVIPDDADVLKHIVKVDMHDTSPFIKQVQILNKKGDKVTYKKKEIRDSIIWYSYQEYIEKNKLEDCYFISNNIKEFGADGANKAPKEEPYPLHPVINKRGYINAAYRNVHDFLVHNSDEIDYLTLDMQSQILSEDLFLQVEAELKQGLAEELITEFLTDKILGETQSFLSDKDPDDIHEEYYMGGYVDPQLFGEIKDIVLREVDIYGGAISVSVDLEVEADVDIYLYNPVHDTRDEKFQFCSTDNVVVKENIVFLIPIIEEKEINKKEFSLREYIAGVKPENVNVEVIEMENIGHTDMFSDFVDDGLDLNY